MVLINFKRAGQVLKNKEYTISVLEDYSRLDEVYTLTHDTLVLSGEITPQDSGKISTCPHLDNHPNTTILIAEQEGEIIGTITVTIDSEQGLNMESWFQQELVAYRELYSCKLASCWRLATSPSCRNKTRLIVDLYAKACKLLLEAGCEMCLCALMNRHKSTYQRLMDANVIVTKSIEPFHKDIPMEINLMKINLEMGLGKFKKVQLNLA